MTTTTTTTFLNQPACDTGSAEPLPIGCGSVEASDPGASIAKPGSPTTSLHLLTAQEGQIFLLRNGNTVKITSLSGPEPDCPIVGFYWEGVRRYTGSWSLTGRFCAFREPTCLDIVHSSTGDER